MLLLISVLLLAQLASFAVHFRDRGEILEQVAGYNLMQRIAGMVNVLDGYTPEERTDFVRAMDLPPLRLSIQDTPLDLPDDMQESMQGAMLHRLLHFRLGHERTVMVYVPADNYSYKVDTSPPLSMDDLMRSMRVQHMRWAANTLKGIVVQVELSHGQWALFRYRLPDEFIVWPWGLIGGLAVLLLGVLVVSVVAVRWITRPLGILADAADQLGCDLGHAPLPEVGPMEVKRAARAFNNMQQRLANFVEERTRILTAVSHDLKTPITRMRLRLELMDDKDLREKFDHDLQEMQSMVQSSLDFMCGLSYQEEPLPIDVDALIGSLCEDAADSGHVVKTRGRAKRPYMGRPMALRRAIGNLLDNAIRYAGDAEIRIEDSGSLLKVVVADNGPGLPEELLDKVFEPFFRVDSSRNQQTGGTGLGLSIARNIARSLGGDLRLRNRSNGGLEATLTLPG